MKDLIPHQLHLTRKQINALTKGSATNVPFAHMGSGAGEVVVMLHPQNARKLLTSYKKGKGMRLKLTPEELETSMIHGSGFNIGKAFKKMGRDIKKGFNKEIARPVSGIARDIERGAKKTFTPQLGRDILSGLETVGRPVGSFLIHEGIPVLGNVAGEALATLAGNPELAPFAGALGQSLATRGADALGRKTGLGMRKGSAEMKERMAMLRAMRGQKEGKGLFKTLHKMGIKGVKKPLTRIFKEAGKATAKVASQAVGEAIGAYTGNPQAGEAFSRIADATAERAIDKGVKSGLSHGAKLSKKEATKMAVEAVDDYVDTHLTGREKEIAERALAGKYKSAGDLIYDMADYNPSVSSAGFGMKRGRGRPRKGMGASMSAVYQKAMENNFSGLKMSNVANVNKPLGGYTIDRRVKAPNSEMTLSPYQSPSAPAMNPFIPRTYVEEGGASCGYGGKGLYGGRVRGMGLYGGGLYGGGLY